LAVRGVYESLAPNFQPSGKVGAFGCCICILGRNEYEHNVPLTIIFYGLFKVVDKNVALLEAIFGLMSTAV